MENTSTAPRLSFFGSNLAPHVETDTEQPLADNNNGIRQNATSISNTAENLETHVEIPPPALSMRSKLIQRIQQENQKINHLQEEIRQILDPDTTVCGTTISIMNIQILSLFFMLLTAALIAFDSFYVWNKNR